MASSRAHSTDENPTSPPFPRGFYVRLLIIRGGDLCFGSNVRAGGFEGGARAFEDAPPFKMAASVRIFFYLCLLFTPFVLFMI